MTQWFSTLAAQRTHCVALKDTDVQVPPPESLIPLLGVGAQVPAASELHRPFYCVAGPATCSGKKRSSSKASEHWAAIRLTTAINSKM